MVQRRFATLECIVDADVILEIAADILVGMDDVDPEALCRCSAGPTPDSCRSCGELIEPPETITSRPARAVCFVPFCSYSTPTALRPSNKILRRQRIRLDANVLALHGRPQEGACGRHAPSVSRRDLVDADALLRGAVEIRIERQPCLIVLP